MKTFSEFINERVVSVVQRKKQARRMAKMAKSSSFKAKKKKAMLKMRNPAKLAMAARKKTVQSFRDKFYPSYGDMSLQQRVKVDQLITVKYGKKIDKIAKKMAMGLKKKELERIKAARAKLQDA
tara:strand:+ start:632 stop:1003 length:372 start_codon:yes stop_codon:yes gene_type:complete